MALSYGAYLLDHWGSARVVVVKVVVGCAQWSHALLIGWGGQGLGKVMIG